MKKITLIAILVIGAGLLLPFVFGMMIQDNLEQQIARTNSQSNGVAITELAEYDRGWLTSSGYIRMRFSDEYVQNLTNLQQQSDVDTNWVDMLRGGFKQDINVSHGPFSSGGLGIGHINAVMDEQSHPDLKDFLAKTGNDYLATWDVDIGLTGTGTMTFSAPRFEIQNASDSVTNITFAGLEGSGDFDFTQSAFSAQGQFNGLSLTGAGNELVVERSTFSSSMTYPEHAPFGLGDFEMAIDRIVMLQKDQSNLDLKQVKVGYDITSPADETSFNMQVAYDIEEMSVTGTRIDQFKLVVDIENLAGEALQEFQKVSAEMPIEPSEREASMQKLASPAYDLLAAGVSIKLAPMSLVYNDQPVSTHITITTKKDRLPPKDQFTFENPLLLAGVFAVDADLSIHKALAIELAIPQVKEQLIAGIPDGTEIDDAQLNNMAEAQAPVMLGALVGQGMLTEEGDNYTVNVQYDLGNLIVNGAPIPLDAFLQNQ